MEWGYSSVVNEQLVVLSLYISVLVPLACLLFFCLLLFLLGFAGGLSDVA
jgi:hypothetical protein